MFGGDQGAGADLEVAEPSFTEELVDHGHADTELPGGLGNRGHSAPAVAARLTGTAGVGIPVDHDLRERERLLVDLVLEGLELAQALLETDKALAKLKGLHT